MSFDVDSSVGSEPVHCPPVLFLIFNRPDLTARVFARIRDAQPRLLFVAADGPRADRDGEVELCAATRAIVDHGVDWDCEVKRLYRDANLGCKIAVSSAIDWFFANVEEGIILEDDTLPDPSFFPYCAELLDRYRDELGVAMISGDNFQGCCFRCEASYYFSILPHIWGWATWRRAWINYDVDLKDWKRAEGFSSLKSLLGSGAAAKYFADGFDQIRAGTFDTWDFPWVHAIWRHFPCCIAPAVNLVENIGFDDRATHTNQGTVQPSFSLQLPLTHPSDRRLNRRADKFALRNHYGIRPARIWIREMEGALRRFLKQVCSSVRQSCSAFKRLRG